MLARLTAAHPPESLIVLPSSIVLVFDVTTQDYVLRVSDRLMCKLIEALPYISTATAMLPAKHSVAAPHTQ